MRPKTLLALAIAGALGTAGNAFAWSGMHHSAQQVSTPVSVTESTPWINSSPSSSSSFSSASFGSASMHGSADDGMSLRMSDSLASSSNFGEGVALGTSSGVSGTGSVAYSSSDDSYGTGASSSEGSFGSVAYSTDSDTHASDPFAMEVYIVPAPLASNGDTEYWKETITEPSAEALANLETDNVYVMTPNYDAIVDPRIVLSQGPDAINLAELSSEDFSAA